MRAPYIRDLTVCQLFPIQYLTHWGWQNGCHFADEIFKCIFFDENVQIVIKISLEFVPKVPINNIPALVQIMVWRRLGLNELTSMDWCETDLISYVRHFEYPLLIGPWEMWLWFQMWKFQTQLGDQYSSKHHPGKMLEDLTDCKLIMVQVMAWCLTAPSHYLN